MDDSFKESLWKQFGASIDMFENALKHCPAELWNTDSKFWYIAYHTLFFLDYYLTREPDKFMPPPQFSLSEFDPDGTLPERVYSKEELTGYTNHCRNKCREMIAGLNDANASERWINEYRNYSIFEILIYNLRHVQHHAGQLNLLLRQGMNSAPDWVSRTKVNLSNV